MARPTGGPGKGRVELQPAVPGCSLRGWVYSRRGAFRGCRARVSRFKLGPLSGTHGGKRTGREPQGGVPGGQPPPPRRPGPGREQGGRLLGRLRTEHPARGATQGVPSRGDPQKADSLPAQPHLVFSSAETEQVLSRFSPIQLFATQWTVACQAPLSTGFSKQEYWSGLPCPPPGDLPDPGIEPMSPSCIAGRFFTDEPPGKPKIGVEDQ